MTSYTKILLHIIFSTSNREPELTDPVRECLFGYLAGIVSNLKGHLIRAGGVEDHVHLVVKFPATITLADFMKNLKASSSKWLKDERLVGSQFAWQRGYAAFSVSASGVEKLIAYVDSQREHHRKRTLKEELVEFLNAYGVDFNEEYLFEE